MRKPLARIDVAIPHDNSQPRLVSPSAVIRRATIQANVRSFSPGSKHFNKTLRDVPISYIDWLLGHSDLDRPRFLLRQDASTLRRPTAARGHFTTSAPRSPSTPVASPPLDAQLRRGPSRSSGGRWRRTIRGILTGERLPSGARPLVLRIRKPGNWSQCRPRVQAEAEDEGDSIRSGGLQPGATTLLAGRVEAGADGCPARTQGP